MLVVATTETAGEHNHRDGYERVICTDSRGDQIPRHEQHEHHESDAPRGHRPLGVPPTGAIVVGHDGQADHQRKRDKIRHVRVIGGAERRLNRGIDA